MINLPISPFVTAATTRRVLGQLLRDIRSTALILLVPCWLVIAFYWALSSSPGMFARVGPRLFAVLPFVVMFALASIITSRERCTGTLQRLLTMPARRTDLLAGYVIAFISCALVQAVVMAGLTVGILDLPLPGDFWLLVLSMVLTAILGAMLGLLTSAVARSQHRAVLLLPLWLGPQILLCGLLFSTTRFPRSLRWVADLLPLNQAVAAVSELSTYLVPTRELWTHLIILGGYVLLSLVAASFTLRRRTA
ncbi:ABC transporter permease [Pseudonocardiaceae bacterium YIM PH 21723]|nr:ABC transporter permease [Pseudonocardiaceae bacterium YIM PH 21723]